MRTEQEGRRGGASRRAVVTLLVAGWLAVPVVAPAAPAKPQKGRGIAWLASYQAAVARAQRARKPVMVDFSTPW